MNKRPISPTSLVQLIEAATTAANGDTAIAAALLSKVFESYSESAVEKALLELASRRG